MQIKNFINNENNYLTLFLLFIIVFIDQAGILLIVPLLPFLLKEISNVPLVETSHLTAIILASYAFMQFIFAPIIGSLSDKYGRKIILILCLSFFAIDYLIMALSNNIWVLFVGRLLSGISGASTSAVFACVSDFSDKDSKVKNYGIILSAIGLGFILGALLGGTLASLIDLRTPFWTASLFCLLNIFICLKFLPETLPKEKRKYSIKITNPIHSIIKIGRYTGIKEMQIAQFLTMIGFQAPICLWSFYGTTRLNWNLNQITISLSIFGLLYVLVQTIVVKYTYNILGNKKSIILGSCAYSLGLFLISISNNSFSIYIALVVFSLGGILSSSVMNIFSMKIPKDEQGELQGVIASINSLCSIIGPLIMNYLYRVGLNSNILFKDGFVFIFAAFLFLLSIPFCNIAFKKMNLEK